jgi:hypothetical protein
MKRINFKELSVYTGVAKREKATGDSRESFANVIYTCLSGIRAKNLALNIFNSDGEIELSDEDVNLIRSAANTYCTPAFIDAINEQLKD